MKKVIVPILVFLFALSVLSFTQEETKITAEPPKKEAGEDLIKWMTWENAMELFKTKKKKILVNIYTDQCGWCQQMDRTTYQKEQLAKYINKNYYPIRLNAEHRDAIKFNDKVYKYVKSGDQSYHELAASITMGGLGTPALVFIDESLEVIQPILGYKDPDNFEVIVTYFAENQYLTIPWDIYESRYIPMGSARLMSDE